MLLSGCVWIWWAMGLWFALECVFYVWYRCELRRAQRLTPPPKVSLEDRSFVLEKMLLHAKDYGLWRQVQGWFHEEDANRSPHEIGDEDFLELLAWAFFYKQVEDLDADEVSWINYALKTITTDYSLPEVRPGRTGVVPIKHTLDRIRAIHRPLSFYAVIHLGYFLHGLLLRLRGFRRGRKEGLHYWYRLDGQRAADGRSIELGAGEGDPLAFFHGVGLGLLLYFPLLLRFEQKEQLLFEMPWIAMNPFAEVPSSLEYARWVSEALQEHGVQRCVAVGHSFGSLPVAWLVRNYPNQISRCVLVDPVCMLLNLPDVCVNFLYKHPRTLFSKVIRYVGAREFGVARCLMRHFYWTDSVLFPEMLPAGSSVILMEGDRILPVKDIYTSCAKIPELRTVVVPGLDHGQFLTWPSISSIILDHAAGM